MPDIAMCKDDECPSQMKCNRYTAVPSKYRQTYGDFRRSPGADFCRMFWSNYGLSKNFEKEGE